MNVPQLQRIKNKQSIKRKFIQQQHHISCDKADHISWDCPVNKNKKKCDRCRGIGHDINECKYSDKYIPRSQRQQHNNFDANDSQQNQQSYLSVDENNYSDEELQQHHSHVCYTSQAL